MLENVNTTMNVTEPSSCLSNPTAGKIGKTFAYFLIFLVSLAGNSVIGIIVYKTKTMRKPINFLIVNMAISDLLFPIFAIPWVIRGLYLDSWLIGGPLGQALCKLVNFLPTVSTAVSTQSLVLIAVDRFGAVVIPLRSPLISSKLCLFLILASWIGAMAVFSPYFFALKLVEYPEGLVCETHWNEVFGESSVFEKYIVSISVGNFISLVLIATLYIIIYLKLKSQYIPGEQSAHAVNTGQQRHQRQRNVFKMSFAIVLGFAVCLLPYCIFWLLNLFVSGITTTCGFQYFTYIALFMAHANCAVNPCICFIFSGNYRQGLKTLLGFL